MAVKYYVVESIPKMSSETSAFTNESNNEGKSSFLNLSKFGMIQENCWFRFNHD